MNTIVQWATILSPIVAVIIAAVVSRKSAKDTVKQIAAIEESTKKQMEAMKRLSLLQLSSAYDALEMSLYEYSLGKENDNLELRALSDELHLMKEKESIDPIEMNRLQHKIDNLRKNVGYKGNFETKIILQQFRIVEEMERFKKFA